MGIEEQPDCEEAVILLLNVRNSTAQFLYHSVNGIFENGTVTDEKSADTNQMYCVDLVWVLFEETGYKKTFW